MAAKNRQKSSSSVAHQDDASKKTPKSSNSNSSGGGGSNGTSVPAAKGTRSGCRGCLGSLLTAGLYVALIGAAGVAAFYAQQVVEDVKQMRSQSEESARRTAEMSSRMESVSTQVESLRSVMDGLESSVGVTRVELEGAVSRMKRNEVETRRVEEALLKLQNNLLRDLSEGIAAVKTSREEDFSSLEKMVEARLTEVSQSIAANMAVFTEAQEEAEQQLEKLKAQFVGIEDPGLLKQELAAIVDAVAEIKTSKEASDLSTESLRAQIGAVRDELQTRNQEVASMSQEVESVRSVVQTTSSSLRASLSSAEAEIQTLKDKTETLERSVAEATEAASGVESQASAAAADTQRRSDELEAKMRTSEEDVKSLSVALTSKVEKLSTKFDLYAGVLSAQGQSLDKTKKDLQEQLEKLSRSLEELRASHTGTDATEAALQEVEARLTALELLSHNSELQSLQSVVTGLERRAAKQEAQEQAIAALQDAVLKTTETLSTLAAERGQDE